MFRTRLYREQHARIRALTLPLLAQDRGESSAADLRTALAKLAGALKVHLRDEDAKLYPELARSEDAALRDTAVAFRTTLGSLAVTFAGFHQRWIKPGAIEDDRPGFLRDVDAVLALLARRMDLEDRELYPMADRYATERRTQPE